MGVIHLSSEGKWGFDPLCIRIGMDMEISKASEKNKKGEIGNGVTEKKTPAHLEG